MYERAPIERHFPWRELREVSRRQGTRKPPIYSVHRWWARRPPELYRTILTRLVPQDGNVEKPLSGRVVLDPFMGGGTTLVEAQALGAAVIGFDTEELACRITAMELASPPDATVWHAIDRAIGRIERKLRQFYGCVGAWEVLHYFWVDAVACGACHRSFDAHPQAVLARDAESKRIVAFCIHCSQLHEIGLDRMMIYCACGKRTRLNDSNARGGKYRCPWCRHEEVIRDYVRRTGDRPPRRRLVAKEEVNHKTKERRFRRISTKDRALYGHAARALRRREEKLPIPQARVMMAADDSRPRSYGYKKYCEMFNARQLLNHGAVLKELRRLRGPARSIALLAFSESLATNCMFCLYSTDWRRLAGLFSIHGYMYVTRPVELNPWLSGPGRGTLRNCLGRVRRALDSKRDGNAAGVRLLCVGSLDEFGARHGRVDFVVTDPPYFDNLNYEYLARFHSVWVGRTWLRSSKIRKIGGKAIKAAPSGENPYEWKKFLRQLRDILRRCRRLLKWRGLLVFTFAHRTEQAWRALRGAIRGAGFQVTAVYGIECEGKNGFHGGEGNLRWNALFVCRRRGGWRRLRAGELRRAIRSKGLSKADRANLRMALKVALACR